MALVTGRTGVHIVLPAVVLLVGIHLVVLMAINATENRIVTGCAVAVITCSPLARVIARVDGELVRHLCPGPLCGGVTGCARGGEARCDVVGIRNGLESLAMAGVAVGRRSGVAVSHVTVGAGHPGVRTGKRKSSFSVIEGGAFPLRGGVADGAILGKASRYVVGIRRSGVIGKVAANTRRRSSFVDVVLVTDSALQSCMRARQRELRRRCMVELCTLPLRGRMADRTVAREGGGDVIRVRCPVVVCDMAALAGSWGTFEDSVHMALGTLCGSVSAGERELCSCGMVEFRPLPLRGAVARGAFPGEPGSDVIRIRGASEILQVATFTSGRRPLENVVDMTLCTLGGRMCAG